MKSRHPVIIILLMVAAIFLPSIPFVNIVISPINQFVTCVHELGHAVFCLLTGGYITGLTIVGDGQGHGGLTFCHGGNPFIYMQTGYLGTTLLGCTLIMLGKFPKLSKSLLVCIGLFICAASVFLMPGTLFQEGRILEGLGSIVWGLIIGIAFIFSGTKLSHNAANWFLLFIATQTALNALNGVFLLARLSMQGGHAFTDATNMESFTGIPAIIWAGLWALVSILLFAGTLYWTYAPSLFHKKQKKELPLK